MTPLGVMTMSNLFSSASYAVASIEDAKVKAANFGSLTAEYSEGGALFKVCMLALATGVAKLDFDGAKLYTVYADAQNASPLTKKAIDLKAPNALANKASLLNAYRKTGEAHGEKAYGIVEAIVGKLNSKGAKGYNVDKVRGAFKAVKADGTVDLKAIEPIAKGKKKPSVAKEVTVGDALEASMNLLAAYAKQFKKEGAFAAALKVLQAVAPAKATPKAPGKAKTATAPRKVSAKS